MNRRKAKTKRRVQQAKSNKPSMKFVKLSDIKPYEDNPRDNEEAVAAVRNSIEEFGFIIPMLLDDDNVIVAGHTRYAAATELKLTEVPAIYATHLTDDQVKAFRMIDNKTAELATWDLDLLQNEISQLIDSGLDFTMFGWSREEVDCLTEVVSDDCLSGNLADDDNDDEGHSARVERRAPNTTRMVLGEFTFFIPSSVYRRWAERLRNEFDFDEEEIKAELIDRLGISPYLESENPVVRRRRRH